MHHTTKGMETPSVKILAVQTKHHIVSGRKLIEDLYGEVNKDKAPTSIVTIHEKTPKHRRARTVIIGTTKSNE